MRASILDERQLKLSADLEYTSNYESRYFAKESGTYAYAATHIINTTHEKKRLTRRLKQS